MKTTVIRSRLNPKLEVSLIAGHFATRHSHNSHYIDITRMKHEHTMAREAAMTLAQRYAYEKGVEIRSRISEHLMVNGSPERFSRLVDILLDNAVKHTPSGGIVEVVLSREKNHAVLSVRNSGEEISPVALPHVFDRFYRADSARSRETGGYGLGLAIAKSIVENAHGKISAKSADNHTTFSVELPIYAEAHPGSGADA